ncbi:GNAT family N-acetyltransferase [Bdellovibrionota bacterium]
MKYRKMETEEISRIGEVNREETVRGEWTAKPDKTGLCICASFNKLDEPMELPPWGEKGVEARIQRFKPALEQGGVMYGAFEKERLAGFVILGPRRSRDGSAEVAALFVDKDHRGKGIARELMKWVEEEALRREIRVLFLYSNPTESSVGFYRKAGFKIVGLTSTELLRSFSPDLTMAKSLVVGNRK